MERMQEALRLAQRGDLSAALCLDLDRFKAVNDRLGHAIGDKVLEAVGERLRNQLRGTDTAARLGGDEFAMIQGRIRSAREAQTIAQRIVTDLSRPYQIGAHEIRIGASIGIEMIDGSEQNPASILRNADLALYRAKSSGGGDVTFYEPAMQTRLDERHRLEAQLREAVSDSSLVLHYQPQVDLRSGEIMGFEALVRWQHPTRGLLEPVDFIHVAEEIGVIRQLGVRVLDLACLEAAGWSRPVSVSVNLSSNQFADDGVVYDVASALQRSGLAPARLILEVTEAVLISNSPAALALLGRLKGLGVRISLDNLGVGPSFVSYAPRDVFDSVKIDPSILAMSSGKPGGMDLIEAYAAFCQTLGMSPTIGGVESQAQLARLEPGGCAVGQGFAFARPVPANDVHQLLESAKRL
jgi:diguanylate cyclase (GGDEF)-like protein